jgi:GNAT superfamily N-acetyltransferase
VTAASQVTVRPATAADLPACEEIWRDGLNDYLLPLGQMEIPADNASLRSLHAHTLATDPELFWVAEAPDAEGVNRGLVGFASAYRRGRVWFLSMLFVRPGRQGSGVGRALLERILPGSDDVVLAVATDAAQPISNGLYASLGMVPRMPMFNLVGRPAAGRPMPSLPGEVRATRFDAAGAASAGSGRSSTGAPTAAELDELDAAVLGYAHPVEHEFLRSQGRIGFAFRDGSGGLVGYGYTSQVGRIGPIAVREPSLLAPLAAHLLEAVTPRGASALWVPGDAGPTFELLVRAGLRIEGFPVLIGWTRAFADFARYVPISPGLL